MQLAGADARLYATLETALNQYAGDARQECQALGCRHTVLKVTDSIQMQPAERRKLMRRVVTEWDTLPLSEAEFKLFGRIAEVWTAYDYEVRSGHRASERVCLLCRALVSQCCC